MKPPELLPEFVREALESEGTLGAADYAASAEALAALAALLPPLTPSSSGRSPNSRTSIAAGGRSPRRLSATRPSHSRQQDHRESGRQDRRQARRPGE